MKQTELKKETDANLAKTLAAKREEVRAFRFSVAGSAARDVKALRTNRKDVARILTELRLRARHA